MIVWNHRHEKIKHPICRIILMSPPNTWADPQLTDSHPHKTYLAIEVK
jgi:hypothetical protein